MTRALRLRGASSWLTRGSWSGVSPDAPPSGSRNAYLSPGKSPTGPGVNDGNPYVTPIGANAVLVDARLGFANAWQNGNITADPIHIGVNPSDPVKTMTSTAGQGSRSVRVPASMTHNGQLNGCAVFLDSSDPSKVHQGQPLNLSAGGNPTVQYLIPTTAVGITGTEVAGTHGGSFLSALLGTIRAWEYDLMATDEFVLQHALAVNVDCYRYAAGVPQGKTQGYRYPATTQDSYWQRTADGYGQAAGANPAPGMGMGTLLTTPNGYDLTYLTNPYARAIARAFQGFGGYIVDDTHWHVYALSVERARSAAFEALPAAFHSQMQTLFQDLVYVDNNSASNIGGGGSFRVAPPAPLAAL